MGSKKIKIYILIILLIVGCKNASESINEDIEIGSVTDIDGNNYKTVKIGDQWWMAENLKVTHYRNGDKIQRIFLNNDWSNLLSGAYCEYNCNSENYNNEEYVQEYGRLYNWYVIADNRGIAPEGWHVPTDDDWKIMESYIGLEASLLDYNGWRGINTGNELKSVSGWYDGGNGTDIWDFNAYPGGSRYIDGNFIEIEHGAYFWTATESHPNHAWHRQLRFDFPSIYYNDKNKRRGYSVRCIKN